jgi:hypothetical protein
VECECECECECEFGGWGLGNWDGSLKRKSLKQTERPTQEFESAFLFEGFSKNQQACLLMLESKMFDRF